MRDTQTYGFEREEYCERGSPIRRNNAQRVRVSPLKPAPRPLSLPTAPLPAYSIVRARPETPSPMSEEQRRSQYTPMTTSDDATCYGRDEELEVTEAASTMADYGGYGRRSGLVRIPQRESNEGGGVAAKRQEMGNMYVVNGERGGIDAGDVGRRKNKSGCCGPRCAVM